MALSDETDAVEALRLILKDNTVAGEWSGLGAKPDFIEKAREQDRQTKLNRAYNAGSTAVYLWSPAVGNFPQFDAEWDYEDIQVVQAEGWSVDPDEAGAIASDVRSILFTSWVRDNKANTAWNEIAPFEEDDQRASTIAGRSQKAYQVDVRVRFKRLVEP